MVEVVAALIWDKDKFMICQRPKTKTRALQWEFVGGKVESGETKQEALKRECKEELDAQIEVFDEFMTVFHKYPDIEVELTIFNAELKSSIKMLEHNDIKWITEEEIDLFDFCPADKDILAKIKENQREKKFK